VIGVLALIALAQAAGTPPQSVPASRSTLDELVHRIGRKDAGSVDLSEGYLFARSGPPVVRVMPADFLKSIEGCDPDAVSYRYSELRWVCKGRIGSNPTPEEKYKKCFDLAPTLMVREVGPKVVALVIDGNNWSTDRCGESPVFVPAPPPMPEKK
jgi:hypothetical protein